MAIVPPQVVPAPEARGLRYGLLQAANGPIDLTPGGIAGGITYDPVSCGIAHTYAAACHSETSKSFDASADSVTREPFVVYSSLVCGSAGTTPATLEERVRRRLALGEQTVVESAMAAVLAAGVVADGTALIAPGTTLHDVIGELEQWLYGSDALPVPADAQYGAVGYLHASPRIAAHAMAASLLVPDGPLLRTRMGTIFVFGGGYPDDGVIYVSGNVTVWRSPDVFVPPPKQTLNQGTNQYYVLAEREYAVSYDCVVASAIYDWGIPT